MPERHDRARAAGQVRRGDGAHRQDDERGEPARVDHRPGEGDRRDRGRQAARTRSACARISARRRSASRRSAPAARSRLGGRSPCRAPPTDALSKEVDKALDKSGVDDVIAIGEADVLAGKTNGMRTMQVISGRQTLTGCFKPIDNTDDLPIPELGALPALMSGLGLPTNRSRPDQQGAVAGRRLHHQVADPAARRLPRRPVRRREPCLVPAGRCAHVVQGVDQGRAASTSSRLAPASTSSSTRRSSTSISVSSRNRRSCRRSAGSTSSATSTSSCLAAATRGSRASSSCRRPSSRRAWTRRHRFSCSRRPTA